MAGIARAIRDGWLILGLTIILILFLESAYRLQLGARRAAAARLGSAREQAPAYPFDTSAWAAEYMREHSAIGVRWAPYVYRRHAPVQGRFINIDSLGHRVTPRPKSSAERIVRVYFFGGSTTFGWFQRDGYTIPAEAARRLEARFGESARVEVTNFAVAGHTFTQGVLELFLRLRSGARPDIVLFYDGINDVMSTAQNRRAGFPQNEWNRENDFARGRRLAAESAPGIANDSRAVRHMMGSVLSRMQLAQRIRARQPVAPPPAPVDSLAADLVRMYTGTVRIVEALAARYGFQAIYVWQPALLSTRKPLTPWERWLLRDRPADVGDLHMAVPRSIGSAMAAVVGPRFIDATELFRDDSLDVYLDLFGHTYERANPRIVDTLMPALGAAIARSGPGTSANSPQRVRPGQL